MSVSPFEQAALTGLAVSATLALATWVASVWQRDASLVDRTWSLLVAAPAIAYAAILAPPWNLRTLGMAALLAAWALRLAVHVTLRNRGHGEDRRYQAIRARNEPDFAVKSLYLVFGLQALLAWLVSAPLLGVFTHDRGTAGLDLFGLAVVAAGLACEAAADAQLARFKADPASRDRVMDRGLWRYSRHPNYFGEFCVWWGFFFMALPMAAWSIVSPLLMSVLLLRVSGVVLLEKDIGERRPAYRDYVRRTSAFFPWPPKRDG